MIENPFRSRSQPIRIRLLSPSAPAIDASSLLDAFDAEGAVDFRVDSPTATINSTPDPYNYRSSKTRFCERQSSLLHDFLYVTLVDIAE